MTPCIPPHALNDDRWLWRFLLSADTFVLCESPPGVDAPNTWVNALQAVARDVRHLRYGREVHVNGLVWHLIMNDEYAITFGWSGSGGLHDFSSFNGLTMDTSYEIATVWVAETVQDDLAGFESVQWPSKQRHLLAPKIRNGAAVWIDPHTNEAVANIGNLSEYSTRT